MHKKTEYRSITKHFMTHLLLFWARFFSRVFKVGLPKKTHRVFLDTCPGVRTLFSIAVQQKCVICKLGVRSQCLLRTVFAYVRLGHLLHLK